ncbi:uncharacterized protein LOC117106628 [Anneissia japonica]|uniref:uncharacterized protein LOC117106628 n=1 Tax=Anneissia japonica TaxID=1529436 RepID=UPI0014257742|nr:uncharacterized protein LOC117106628 [Anneissia japonica]
MASSIRSIETNMNSTTFPIDVRSILDLEEDDITGHDPSSLILATVVIFFGIFIHVSNIFIILTVLNLQSASNPDALIFSLSLVDYIMTITVFPVAAYHYWTGLDIPTWACSMSAFFVTANILFSTTVVSLMTIDRLLAIRKPIIYKLYLTTSNMIKLLVFIMFLSIGTASISLTDLIELQSEDEYCLFEAKSWYNLLILTLIYPQIPIVVYTYSGFVHALKMFDPRQNQAIDSGKVEKKKSNWRRYPKRSTENQKSKSTRKGNGNNSVNFKRCIRMSRTVAAIVILYYIPCLIWTASILTDWILGRHLDIFSHVSIFLIMIDSSFNIIVYAVMCLHYRRTFHKVVCSPLRMCGFECYRELPLGLTQSEIQHISNIMVLTGAERPGITRRGHMNDNRENQSQDDMVPIDNPAFSNPPSANVSDDVIVSTHSSDPNINQSEVSDYSLRKTTTDTTRIDSEGSSGGVDNNGIIITIPEHRNSSQLKSEVMREDENIECANVNLSRRASSRGADNIYAKQAIIKCLSASLAVPENAIP